MNDTNECVITGGLSSNCIESDVELLLGEDGMKQVRLRFDYYNGNVERLDAKGIWIEIPSCRVQGTGLLCIPITRFEPATAVGWKPEYPLDLHTIDMKVCANVSRNKVHNSTNTVQNTLQTNFHTNTSCSIISTQNSFVPNGGSAPKSRGGMRVPC